MIAPNELNRLLQLLSGHIGQENGLPAKMLGAIIGTTERQVRKLISALRMEGAAICGTPETGYFIAATAEELDETCQFLRHRAMHSLQLESRLRNIPMPDLLGQLHIPT
jgi:biotin operon repressor